MQNLLIKSKRHEIVNLFHSTWYDMLDIKHPGWRTILIISVTLTLIKRLFAGAAGIMNPRLHVWLLLLLAVATVTVLAQKRRPTVARDAWNYRDGCEHPDYSLFTLGQRSSSGLMLKWRWKRTLWPRCSQKSDQCWTVEYHRRQLGSSEKAKIRHFVCIKMMAEMSSN